MKFETNIEKIENILSKLEGSNVSLDECMNLFEQGINLTKECFEYLNEYKGKFEIIQNKFANMKEEQNGF